MASRAVHVEERKGVLAGKSLGVAGPDGAVFGRQELRRDHRVMGLPQSGKGRFGLLALVIIVLATFVA
jgi:hypothetical protein